MQIGDENVHRVRPVMDELFGEENFCSTITFAKNSGATDELLASPNDHLVWFAKDKRAAKFRRLFWSKTTGSGYGERYGKVREANGYRWNISKEELENPDRLPSGAEAFTEQPPISAGHRANTSVPFTFQNVTYDIGSQRNWKRHMVGMARLGKADRLIALPKLVYYERRISDFPVVSMVNIWQDTQDRLSKNYVVETVPKVIERCIQMTTDPGDLVLDPTCGSGTTATVAEQWGRRWITIDTSRVALALARARIMGARYPFYLLADSRDGQIKEAEVSSKWIVTSGSKTSHQPPATNHYINIRHGFVYERVPHIMLSSISNNAEIDVIWDQWQAKLEPLRQELNEALGTNWQEWEIPRELSVDYADGHRLKSSKNNLRKSAKSADEIVKEWWAARIARQQEIDKSIAAKAEFEFLYDKPYSDNKKVRVAGPFTVESLSPHRVLGVDENDELIDTLKENTGGYDEAQSFPQMILENLKTAGVQQAHKEDKIQFHCPYTLARLSRLCRGTLPRGRVRETRCDFHRP